MSHSLRAVFLSESFKCERDPLSAADAQGNHSAADAVAPHGMQQTGDQNGASRADKMLNTKLGAWALGIFAAITFVICVIWGLVTPQSLHMSAFLEQVLPAFKWLTWWGFLLGLVESFLYGVYAGLVYCSIYNWLYRRWGRT